MRVIILADRLGRELWPLTDDTATAALPLVGKPLLEHTLDMLANTGVKKATMVLGPFADRLRDLCGDGRRWGLELAYWIARGEEEPAAVLAQLPPRPARSSSFGAIC